MSEENLNSIRLEFLEGKVNHLLDQLQKIAEQLEAEEKKTVNPYSDEKVRLVVESILQNKVVRLVEGAVWLKVGNKYVAHNSLIFNEQTGLPRTGEGTTVYKAMCDLARNYIIDEFGLPNNYIVDDFGQSKSEKKIEE